MDILMVGKNRDVFNSHLLQMLTLRKWTQWYCTEFWDIAYPGTQGSFEQNHKD